MQDFGEQKKQKIPLETWERRAIYQHFVGFSEPFHGICIRVDCTATFDDAKQHKRSVFLSLLHRSLVASQVVLNLRPRIVGGEVWLYEVIHGGSAVGRPNGTIGFGHYRYHPRLEDFVTEAMAEVERVKGRDELERYPEANLIRYSTLPWLDFTSLSHA